MKSASNTLARGSARRRDRRARLGPRRSRRIGRRRPRPRTGPAHRRTQRRRPARAGRACWPAPAAGEVAIERPDGPVVDALLDAGLTVVVISPNQVKNLRGRYGSAGNKDDRFDAFVLADTLRTDRARLRPLIPDSPADHRAAPRLPGPQGSRRPPGRAWPTSCARTCATSSPARSACSPRSTPRSAWRSWPASPPRTAPTGSPRARLGWLASGRLLRPRRPRRPARPAGAAPRGATGDRRRRQRHITRALLAVLRHPRRADQGPVRPDRRATRPHPDAHIFTSLPRSGTRPRRPAARRDRRLPRPLPHPRIAGLPRRRRTLHPPVRQDPHRRLPLGLRQATPRRRHRLRRRLPPRQPLGRRPLPPSPRPRPRPPPRRPHPRPRRRSRAIR